MKFLLRSVLVLAVAVVSGLVLYYAVQSLPSISRSGPTGIRIETQSAGNATQNPTPRPEHSENERSGIRWRSLAGVARRTIMFSALVFVAIVAEKIVFRKKPVSKNKRD